MEEDGIIVKEEESTPWVSSMLVIDKRKWKKRTLHSKDDVRIFIDARYLNKVLKRTHLRNGKRAAYNQKKEARKKRNRLVRL